MTREKRLALNGFALVRASCDVLLRLPMRGQVDSLNAAVAGSITLYLALQQRQELDS